MKKYLDYLNTHKERIQIMGAILLVSFAALWVFQKPEGPPTAENSSEIGVDIPKGFLIIPLDLINARQISAMITRFGVIDVFNSRSNRQVAKNLHVLKISSDEASSFGALVPDNKAEALQVLFSDKNLRGALKAMTTEPAEFFIKPKNTSSITTYQTEDIL